MSVQRVVPDLLSRSPEAAKGFYERVLGFEVVMDLGWRSLSRLRTGPACMSAS